MSGVPIFETAELHDLHFGPSENGQKRLAQARRQRLVSLATDTAVVEALDLGDHLPLGVVLANKEYIFNKRAVGDRRGNNPAGVSAELVTFMDVLAVAPNTDEPLSIATNFEPSAEAQDLILNAGINEVLFCSEQVQLFERGLVEDNPPSLFVRNMSLNLPLTVGMICYPDIVAVNRTLLDHTVYGEDHGRPVIDDVSALAHDLSQLAA